MQDNVNTTGTTPASFRNPHSLGNKLGRVLWNICYWIFFRFTLPRLMGRWRRFVLICFGARLGRAWIHPSAEIWAPWLLEIGDDVFISRRVNLYNVYRIKIADRVVISEGAFLCGASHDYTEKSYPLIGGQITVGSDVWIAAQAFIGPGRTIGDGAVIGARSVVMRDAPPWTVSAGNPAQVRKPRLTK